MRNSGVKETMNKPESTDAYIRSFPKNIQLILEKVRETIKKAAPDAKEVISYGMPAFKQNGVLVYFAAWKNHIGFYPTNSGTKKFEDELTKYAVSKGAIQFPIDKPIPVTLISKIVKFRVKEDLKKEKSKKK